MRPLLPQAAAHDPEGWNFGSAWPPSYYAYGRWRALLTLQAARSLRPGSVLELAAGDAALAACLAAEGCRVVANDLRDQHLRAAVADFTNGEHIAIAPGDIFTLQPEQLGQFDLVIACEVIEHVAHAPEFLGRLRQFLAPGGHVLLTTPNGAYVRNRLPTYTQVRDFAALEARQFQPDADGHLYLLTPAELRALAQHAGLSVQELTLWGTPALTGHMQLARLASPRLLRPCWGLERLAQRLPEPLRARVTFNMLAVLAPA